MGNNLHTVLALLFNNVANVTLSSLEQVLAGLNMAVLHGLAC